MEFSADVYKDDISKIFLSVQEDYDTRLGQLQMDIVHLRSAKQQLEHELGCLRVDHDHSQSDMEAMENRHRCVMRSLALSKNYKKCPNQKSNWFFFQFNPDLV